MTNASKTSSKAPRGASKAARPAPAQKAPAQKAPAQKGNVACRRDGSGHLDPAHAERLRGLTAKSQDADKGFLPLHRSREQIAEELGEGAVSNMTSGEDGLADTLDEKVDEESGGPFVETSAQEEFARGTDESNIIGATREPFPRSTGGSD